MSHVRWSLLLLALAGCGEKIVEPVRPSLAVDPEEIDFGEVVVSHYAYLSVQIRNAGRAPPEITSISGEGESSDVYTLSLLSDDDSPLTLDADEAQDLFLTFTPATYRVYESELVIASNDPENPELRVPIWGEGVDGPQPDIEVSPLSIDFGEVAEGASVTAMLSVANVGDGALYIGDTIQAGSGAFSLSLDIEGAVLSPGAAMAIPVSYTPVHPDGDAGSFVIESNDPDESKVEVFFLGNGGSDFDYPVAVIDCPASVSAPAAVTLDGSGSYDPMGAALTYAWTIQEQPSGSAGTIADPAAAITTLDVDVPGSWRVGLQVTSEGGISSAITECSF